MRKGVRIQPYLPNGHPALDIYKKYPMSERSLLVAEGIVLAHQARQQKVNTDKLLRENNALLHELIASVQSQKITIQQPINICSGEFPEEFNV